MSGSRGPVGAGEKWGLGRVVVGATDHPAPDDGTLHINTQSGAVRLGRGGQLVPIPGQDVAGRGAVALTSQAALGAFDRQGASFMTAFTDGSRWVWRLTATVYAGLVVPALGGGFWVREFTGPVRAVWCGVLADGVSDDTAAMQTAINVAVALGVPLELPNGTIITTAELIAAGTLILNGQYSNVGMFEWAIPLKIARTEIRRITRGAAEQAVLRVRGAGSYLSFVQFTASQVGADGFGPIKYDTANIGMVDVSQSSDYGVVLEGAARGGTMYRCEVTQAVKRGIVSGQVYGAAASADGRISPRAVANDQGNVQRLDNVMVASCGAGVTLNATDSKLTNSYLHHNAGEGLLATAAFPHIDSNRSEWNAKQGYIIRAAEFDFIGNLADRNGWSGLWIDSNWRGQVVGNNFSRNGAAGDGVTGRWGFSTPGTPSYLLTPEEECCHIRLKYMRGVTFSGNSFRAGLSDGGDGVLSPACIYYGDNVSDCVDTGTAGGFAYAGGSGGYAAHRLYSSAFEKLINFSQKSMRLVAGLNDSMPTVYGVDVGPLDTVDIALPAEYFGSVEIYGGKFGSSVAAVIDVIRRADNAFSLAAVRSNTGTIAAAATAIAAGVRVSFPAGSQVYLRYACRRML